VPFSSATRTQTALAYVRCSCAARIPKRTGSRCEPSRGVVDKIDWAVFLGSGADASGCDPVRYYRGILRFASAPGPRTEKISEHGTRIVDFRTGYDPVRLYRGILGFASAPGP